MRIDHDKGKDLNQELDEFAFPPRFHEFCPQAYIPHIAIQVSPFLEKEQLPDERMENGTFQKIKNPRFSFQEFARIE